MIISLSSITAKPPTCDYDSCRERARCRCEKCRYWLCGIHSHRGTPGGWVCDPYCL